MRTIYILRGLPASGKSTWARNFVLDNEKAVRWNNDDVRLMAYGKAWGGGPEKFIIKMRDNFIKNALDSDFDVVVDNTNLNPVHLETISGRFYYARIAVVDFIVSVEECIRRDAERERPVGASVITKMAEQYNWPPVDKLQQA